MARFNRKVASTTVPTTTNLAGGTAFSESAKLELTSLVLTSVLGNQFYRTGNASLEKLRELVPQVGAEYAARLAIYARHEHGLRSVSHALAAEVARLEPGARWKRPFFRRVVRRPDDATEIAAYYTGTYGKPLPMALRRGLGDALATFPPYQLAKYQQAGKGWSLVDLANYTHPPHTEAIGQLVRGELTNTGATWEAMLSAAGQAEEESEQADLKASAWADLLRDRKLGYLALVKNLRNIVQQAPEAVPLACEALVNEQAIRGSLVLPFRFLQAERELRAVPGTAQVQEALFRAADLALANVPELEGRTVVALDVSGSMASAVTNGRSKTGAGGVTCLEIASLFAATLAKRLHADVVRFASAAALTSVSPAAPVLSLARDLGSDTRSLGGGTSFVSIFSAIEKRPYDRLIVLSDMQAWMGGGAPVSATREYVRRHGPLKVVSWDLQGYGTLSWPEPHVLTLAGWSDRVLPLLADLDKRGPAGIVAAVSATPIG